MKGFITYEENPFKRFVLKIQTIRVAWVLGEVKNPILNKILDIWFSLIYQGEYEGIIDDVRIWPNKREKQEGK